MLFCGDDAASLVKTLQWEGYLPARRLKYLLINMGTNLVPVNLRPTSRGNPGSWLSKYQKRLMTATLFNRCGLRSVLVDLNRLICWSGIVARRLHAGATGSRIGVR